MSKIIDNNENKTQLENEFDSEFCNVTYKEDANIVLLTWKKFCCFEEYRKPTTFAAELLKKYSGSNFIVDARNGFEDEKEDVEWGFTVYLPLLSKTGCKKAIFILNETNEIEEEMDIWTKEFMKYFVVKKVASYEEAVIYLDEL